MTPIIVDSTQCHLWTDALHARQLAREALNKWDRGTYVRMAVTTVWIALETSCQDALGAADIGYRFKDNLDKAISSTPAAAIDWSSGIWQRVRDLQELRKTFVHRFLSLSDMFPEAPVADGAIATGRAAILDIYGRGGKAVPAWAHIDEAHGWEAKSTFRLANLTVGYHGVTLDDLNAVRIFVVVDGVESLTTVLPSGHDPKESVEHLLTHMKVPINGIRVYERGVLIHDLVVQMRGN